MSQRTERLLLLASGIGAEASLALMLPLLRGSRSDGELATLALALTATAVGRGVGAFKIDTALTNARLDQLTALHRLAVTMSIVCTTVVALAASVFLLQTERASARGDTLAQIVAFFLGAVIQATSMRFLREGRIASYAWSKVGSVAALAGMILISPGQLLLPWLWAAAAFICWATCLILHAYPVERLHLDRLAGQTLTGTALRKLMLVGTPAAVLDALNVYLLAHFVISLVGPEAAADAAALQRMVLGPAIAINLLSSQSLWRVDPAELSNNRSLLVHRTRLVRLLVIGAIATALWGSVLVWSALQQWGRGTTESQVRVASYLMPILAQQLVSPYTVLLFKQSRVATFALLQLILLSALLAGYVFWTSSPATWQNVLAVSLSLSVCTAAATILLTRLKAS